MHYPRIKYNINSAEWIIHYYFVSFHFSFVSKWKTKHQIYTYTISVLMSFIYPTNIYLNIYLYHAQCHIWRHCCWFYNIALWALMCANMFNRKIIGFEGLPPEYMHAFGKNNLIFLCLMYKGWVISTWKRLHGVYNVLRIIPGPQYVLKQL